MKTMDEIAGCPYCGGKAEMFTRTAGLAEKYSVRCKKKHCRGRTVKMVGAKHIAIREWNRRADRT